MSLYKRSGWYWADLMVNGVRYREPLKDLETGKGTRDWREAQRLERERIGQLKDRAPDPEKRTKNYGAMDIENAMVSYITERRAQVSPRMCVYWADQAKPPAAFFKALPLKRLTNAHLADYQNWRVSQGKAPKTINGEVSVLRQLLKHARLWYRFREDYKPIPNTKAAVGRALTEQEQQRLFEVAQRRSDWMYAHAAATLAFFCGMRSCEIKGLHWQDVDFITATIDIRRSKTAAGHRKPSLNDVCRQALANLQATATLIGAANAEHYVFPSHITVENGARLRKIDPTRPMTSWRSAWRSMRKEAGLQGLRFHDGRHTAVTTLCEKGVPDWVIQAQVGHVGPEMMKTYSHIRRQALDLAGEALQPNFPKAPAVAEMVN